MSQLATQSYVTIRDRRMESGARASLALALLRAGDAEGAMTEAQQALALAAPGTEAHAYACAMLAHALLKAVRHAEAMPLAEDAMRVVTVPGSVSSGRQPFMRLVYARALWENGRKVEARAALEAGAAQINAVASRIRTEAGRARFLGVRWEVVQLLEWARSSQRG